MTKISQKEWDSLVRSVEKKTCFRYTAGTIDADTAFMVPVNNEGIALAAPIEFSLEQLRAMAELPIPGDNAEQGGSDGQ